MIANSKYRDIEALSDATKNKLVNALGNDNWYIINEQSKQCSVHPDTMVKNICKWIINQQILDNSINISKDLPKDLSFPERLQLAINLIKYKYEDTILNTPS